jgi:hypothetical protein
MGSDPAMLIERQLAVFETHRGSRAKEQSAQLQPPDPVTLWRFHFADASVRFLEALREPSRQ